MDKVKAYINDNYDKSIIPTLEEFVKIPNQSPCFDPEWATNGLMDKAMNVLVEWVKKQPVKGMKVDIVRDEGKTPLLVIEIDATTKAKHTVLMYGHMDKQPPLLPWDEGLGPYTPVIKDNKLYGRGAADDGYSVFAAISSIAALQHAGIPHGRIIVVIEACEESGSDDLLPYIKKLKDRIGDLNLLICLDSGALSYDQLWLSSSLRGMCSGILKVRILKEGMHSGTAGGVVPDSFRIARLLLDRIEDPVTGEVKIKEAYTEIPPSIKKGMAAMNTLGNSFKESFCTIPGMQLVEGDNYELAVKNFWKPSLTVVGANLPACENAGNVIRSETCLKLSLRCPPNIDVVKINKLVGDILTKDAPYHADVTYQVLASGIGFAAPELKPWLHNAIEEGSKDAFGKPYAVAGVGGSIPFMGELLEMYPKAQFFVTGVLGPQSNAHGPNEFLHIPFVKGVTLAVAHAVAAHAKNEP